MYVIYVFVIIMVNLEASFSLPTFLFPDETVKISSNSSKLLISKVNEDLSCVPLRKCPQLAWLAKANITEIYPNKILSAEMISTTLKSKRCAISEINIEEEVNLRTRVRCPRTDQVGTYPVEIQYDGDEHDFVVRTLFELERTLNVHCSIQLQHGEIDAPLMDLKMTSLSGKRKKYQRLKRLAKRRVLRILAEGPCCWRVYDNIYFNGQSTHIDPNVETFPGHLVKSGQQVKCH